MHTDVKYWIFTLVGIHVRPLLQLFKYMVTCILKKKVLEISSTVALISPRSSGTSTATHVGSIIILRKQSQLSFLMTDILSVILCYDS